jgi:two-component system sensor histidine kinase ChiS
LKSLIKVWLAAFFLSLAITARGGSLVIDAADKIYRLDSPGTLFTFIPKDSPINKSPEAKFFDGKTAEVTLWERWRSIPELGKSDGLGWYRKNLQIKHPAEYALLLPKTFRGVQVFLNGVLVGQTRPFDDNSTPPTIGKPAVISIPSNIVRKGDNLLTFRTGELDGFSSFSYGVYFGGYSQIQEKHQLQIIWNGSIALVMLALSVFFLVFYFYRASEKYHLHFSLFSFFIGMWIFGYSGYGLYLADHYIFYFIFTYCGGFISNVFYLSFIKSFFQLKETIFSKGLKLFFVVMLAVAIAEFALTGSIRTFNIHLHDLYSLGVIIVVVYTLLLNFVAIKKKKKYVVRLLFAQAMIVIPTILLILNLTINLNLPMLMKEGYFLLVVSLSSVLASRYAQVNTELERAHGELLVMDKLKDDFMATASHEIRTPLHGIQGLAETLLENRNEQLTPHQEENLRMIRESAGRLSRLVNDILDFSRLRAGKADILPEPIKLKDTLCGLVSLSKSFVKEGKILELRCVVPEDLPDIHADRHRFEQIMLNLLGNAVKFTDKGFVEVTAGPENGGVAIAVRDSGCGIPADRLHRIWNPYEQADPADTRRYGGSGLGLAITRHLVELHGGRIDVESVPEKGSAFTVHLPLYPPAGIATINIPQHSSSWMEYTGAIPHSEAPVPDVELAESSVKLLKKDDIRILAVDDEPVNLKVVVDALSLEGYRVITATTGQEAIEAVRKHEPHCVLLDIMLPGMSGYEAAQKMREIRAESYLPIIMVTARSRTEDLTKGFLSGANDYLSKPFDIKELLLRVENQLVIRNIVDMEKKVGSHLLHERNRIQTNLLERSAELNEAVHKLSEWERIISEDLNIAKRFLGKLMTVRISSKGVDHALVFDPLHTIGGDVYDVSEYAPGMIRVFLADATGHGINASLNTITIMTEYDLIRGGNMAPGEILRALNGRFCRKLAEYRICFTCCVAEIDLGAGRVRFASAGHPEQYLLSLHGRPVELKPHGPIIGLTNEAVYEEQEFEFGRGSLLFCYTDGLLDENAPTMHGQRDNKRLVRDNAYLKEILSGTYGSCDAGELCRKVKAAMKGERYRKERTTDDDITMIAVAVK